MDDHTCIVCHCPVKVENAEKRVYVDEARLARENNDISLNIITVCSSKRCLRLVSEVIAESGKTLRK